MPEVGFLSSSVSEALFALSFSFLSESLFFVHNKVALAYSRNEGVSQVSFNLCGSYHLLQYCISFFVRLHDSFSSFALLSSSVSTANMSSLLETTFSSLRFLSNSLLSPRFILLRVARHCFAWSSGFDDYIRELCRVGTYYPTH